MPIKSAEAQRDAIASRGVVHKAIFMYIKRKAQLAFFLTAPIAKARREIYNKAKLGQIFIKCITANI